MIAKVLALFEGIKALSSIISAAQNLYDKWQDGKIDNHYEQKKRRRDALTRQIEVESAKDNPDDNKLRELHRKLHNISTSN